MTRASKSIPPHLLHTTAYHVSVSVFIDRVGRLRDMMNVRKHSLSDDSTFCTISVKTSRTRQACSPHHPYKSTLWVCLCGWEFNANIFLSRLERIIFALFILFIYLFLLNHFCNIMCIQQHSYDVQAHTRVHSHTHTTYMRMDTSIYIFPKLTGFTHSISVLVLAI